MYVRLNCLVTIERQDGQITEFDAVNNVVIEKSIDSIRSLAKVRIPTSARLKYSDGATGSTQTAKVFNRGDKITIQLGYDERLVAEFTGFIYRINLVAPLEIECEGYEYLLRGNIPTKTFAKTNLKELLPYIIGDEYLNKQISIHGEMPEVNMVNYIIPSDLTRIDALQQLKERYGLTIYFIDNKLYVGLDFVNYAGDVVYSLGVNTPKADELKYQYAEDVKLKVKAVHINKNNTRFEAEVGDKGGEQRTLFFYSAAENIADLKKLAEAELHKYKYTGYAGKITTFLEPFASPGMVAEIRDINYQERQGKYEIRSVNTTFGTGGGRRTVEIGKTVS